MKRTLYFLVIPLILAACGGNQKKTDTQQNSVKYETYHNVRYNYTVEYPDFLIPLGEATNHDGQKFISEDKTIKLLVYYEYKIDFNSDGEHLPIGEAYKEALNSKDEVLDKKLESNHYTIKYKVDNMLHTDYAILDDYRYFNICFEYPEEEKEMMESILERVIESFKVEDLDVSNASDEDVEDIFLTVLGSFLNDCYWEQNFNSLLRDNDKTLAKYIDPKMDIRRYHAPGTISILASREEDFGFNSYSDFESKPERNDKVIIEYLLEDNHPCDAIFDQNNIIYYQYIQKLSDVVVDNETFETAPVDLAYANADIVAVYIPNEYGNPRGFYFVNTPEGWKLAFVDDSLCGA